jgi:hypothetical protein
MEMIMRTIKINSKKINIDGMKSTIFFTEHRIEQFDINFEKGLSLKKESAVLNLPYIKWKFVKRFPFVQKGADVINHLDIMHRKVKFGYKESCSALIDEIELQYNKGKRNIFLSNPGLSIYGLNMLLKFMNLNFDRDLNIYLFLPTDYSDICAAYDINLVYLR